MTERRKRTRAAFALNPVPKEIRRIEILQVNNGWVIINPEGEPLAAAETPARMAGFVRAWMDAQAASATLDLLPPMVEPG